MSGRPARKRAAGFLVGAVLALGVASSRADEPAPSAVAQDKGAASPSSAGKDTAKEEAVLAPGRIAASVEPTVAELIRKHFSSCGRGGDEVPCFPVTIERQWQYSVADSLRHLEFDQSPSPGRPPTVDEMKGARPGPLSASGGVGFDPVCTGKHLLKSIAGKNRTLYLYRVWDEQGERAMMREKPIDAETFGKTPQVHYVEIGTYTDECQALAAWRKALRETRARRVGAEGQEDEDATILGDDAAEPEGATETFEEPAPQ